MPVTKQDQRVAQLKTPLGKDVLNAVRFDGVEGLSTLFEYSVEAIGDKTPVDFNAAIGKNSSLLLNGKTTPRAFCGVLVGADWLGESDSHNLYRLTLRPWFWLLSRTSNCQIFHDMTTPQIISKVLGKHSFAEFQLKLTENYPPREYTVQYRESDLDFVCRLMEEDGIYYFFEHTETAHKLILADAKSSHTRIQGLPDVLFVDRLVGIRTDTESFLDITAARSFSAGKIALNDYDYGKPSAKMETQHNSPSGYANDSLEIYDYPGRYTETSDGERFAKVRLEAEQAGDKRRRAKGDVPAAVPGGLLTLANHPAGQREHRVSGGVLPSPVRGAGLPLLVRRRRRRRRPLHRLLRAAAVRPPVPRPARDAEAHRAWAADGEGRRRQRRGDRRGLRRAHPRPVLLGPEQGSVAPGAGGAGLGRQGLGRRHDPAHRPGGGGRVSGGRP